MGSLLDFIQHIDMLDPEGSHQLDQLASKTKELQRLPPVAIKILNLTDKPDAKVQDLERVIRNDTAITASVLRIANSSFYSLPKKVETVERAIVILGFRTISNMAVSLAIMTDLYRSEDTWLQRIFQRSLACAIACRVLSSKLNVGDRDELFVVGLLHDMGMVVLRSQSPQIYQTLLEEPQKHPQQLCKAERFQFGFSHTHLGERLARDWGFPEFIRAMTLYHHHFGKMKSVKPEGSFTKQLALVSLADQVCEKMGLGYQLQGSSTWCNPAISEEADYLGLAKENLESWMDDIETAYLEEKSFFGVS